MTDAATPTAEAPAAAPRRPERDWDRARALFRADYLHALEPIIRSGQEDENVFRVAGLIVEPVAEGGALLVATDGRRLAVIHDRTAKASRAMRLTIPDNVFERAAPARGPVMWQEGETFEVEAPEWMQPGLIWAWGLACYVIPKMHIPGEDPRHCPMLAHAWAEEGSVYAGGYRLHPEGPLFGWRALFAKERGLSTGRVNVHPRSLAMFDRIDRLAGGVGIEVACGGPSDALILTIPGHPEFLGATQPCTTPLEDPDLPAWART